MEQVVIARRFRGPPGSGNGGYSCGLVGILAGPVAEATLRRPPPLDTPLAVVREADGRVRLEEGGTTVAEAVPIALELAAPEPIALDDAADAVRGYPWYQGHPFPGCFVCGPERAEGDGLRIFPGAVTGRRVAAAPWTPDPSLADEAGRVRPEIVWSALDCPSWFGVSCFERDLGDVLLGRLTARIFEAPRAGAPCVAAGWSLGTEGRKIHAASALYAADGRVLAVAKAVWIKAR